MSDVGMRERLGEQEFALERLRGWLNEGDEIGTVVTYGRGETDYVECFLPFGKHVERVTFYVARAIGYTGSLERGIPKRGCQYDKATDVVDSLSRALFGEGGRLSRNRLLG